MIYQNIWLMTERMIIAIHDTQRVTDIELLPLYWCLKLIAFCTAILLFGEVCYVFLEGQ